VKYVDDDHLPALSDEEFAAFRAKASDYALCILSAGPNYQTLGRNAAGGPSEIIYNHGKRNVALSAAGLLHIVCPITDDGPIRGIGIFSGDLEEARRIMAADPGVQAGVFTFELHPCRGFPGSTLPAAE
jgi:hypothetical protein